jgi:phosphoribosylanthranilate isomerase
VTDVKICGLTRAEDIELACALGVSYVGFNFAAISPRRVSVPEARRLAGSCARGVARVGVFVSESREEIEAAIAVANLDLVQLHRPLSEEDLSLPRPILAVARMRDGTAELPEGGLLSRCRLVLLDAELPGRPGGTGRTLDWTSLSSGRWPVPLMLAGGLNPENVEEAIERARPSAVDVASGVESSPGVKDPKRMIAFVEAVRRADASREARESRG